MARGFEERHPGVTVRTVADINHGNYEQMIGTRFIGGKPPDVMIMDDLDMVPLNIENLLMPLESFIDDDPTYRTGDFPASMVCDGYVGDTRYSSPGYGDFPCLFYRTDLFAQAGVDRRASGMN